jgi:predicted XRE-type DNA-binding protein
VRRIQLRQQEIITALDITKNEASATLDEENVQSEKHCQRKASIVKTVIT